MGNDQSNKKGDLVELSGTKPSENGGAGAWDVAPEAERKFDGYDQVYAATHLEISVDEPLSIILLMAINRWALVLFALCNFLTNSVIVLFGWYVGMQVPSVSPVVAAADAIGEVQSCGAASPEDLPACQETQVEQLSTKIEALEFQGNLFKEFFVGTRLSWALITIVLFCSLVPKLMDAYKPFAHVVSVWRFAGRVDANRGSGAHLRLAALVKGAELLQPVLVLFGSAYIALLLSEGELLNVLLNVLVLEFVAGLDDAIIRQLVEKRFGGSVSIGVLDCPCGGESNGGSARENFKYWPQCDIDLRSVRSLLRKGPELSNEEKWGLLTKQGSGIGLNERPLTGREKLRGDIPVEITLVNQGLGADARGSVRESMVGIRVALEGASNPALTWMTHVCVDKPEREKMASIFPRFVMSNTLQLLYLSLKDLKLGADVVADIGLALAENRSVKELNLMGNDAGVEGARAVGIGLGQNATLNVLWLGYNGIGEEGACAIGKGLQSNSALQVFRVENNEIGAVGAQAIIDGIVFAGSHSSMTKLELDNNDIGENGAVAIGKALQGAAPVLENLNLFGNQISDEVKTTLRGNDDRIFFV